MTDEPLTRLGMPVPDSTLATQARELIADVAAPFLVNHSVRSYAWAVELARHDELQFDPEILYVSAMLHDIGLVPAFDLGGCYEVDGAIAAERLAREAGEPEERIRAIYDVIALHNNETLPPDSASEVVLLWDSTGIDVTGDRLTDVRWAIIPGLLAAYPRLDFNASSPRSLSIRPLGNQRVRPRRWPAWASSRKSHRRHSTASASQ
jgi:HD domain